jgi:hypothetical protein
MPTHGFLVVAGVLPSQTVQLTVEAGAYTRPLFSST